MKMRLFVIIALLTLPMSFLAQRSDVYPYFDIDAKNVAIHASRLADSAYYFIRQSRIDTTQELNWNLRNIEKATDYLVVAEEHVSNCMEMVAEQQLPQEHLWKAKSKMEAALEEIEYLKETTNYWDGKDAQRTLLSIIKYSSASSYHASMLIIGEPRVEVPEEKVDTSGDALASRIQADSALFNKLMRIYKLELDDLRSRESELMKMLDNPDLPEEDRMALEEELAQVRRDIKERENRIAAGRDQLENLEEEKKLVNNYLTSLAEYEEWEAIEDFPYELDIELPRGLLFRIQIGYYPIRRKVLFGDLQVDASRASKKYVRYFTGMYRSYKEATDFKNKIRDEIGIEDAFLAAYFDGEKVNIKEAIELEKKNGPTQD